MGEKGREDGKEMERDWQIKWEGIGYKGVQQGGGRRGGTVTKERDGRDWLNDVGLFKKENGGLWKRQGLLGSQPRSKPEAQFKQEALCRLC